MNTRKLKIGVLAALLSASALSVSAKDFLNVSYDPTRELYDNFNKEFSAYWKKPLARKSIINSRMAVQANRHVR